jgi:phenylacetate-coenzyme A ligase PaaK-like adenylate-forming protein
MHATAAVAWTFSGPHLTCLQLPVTLPINEIVAGLNKAQPAFLRGYSSALFGLAEEARAGRLQIRPKRVWAGSEPLSGEVRAALEETWGVPVGNVWGTSEGGGMATPCDVGSSHLSEDLNIVEFVDQHGRSVPPGVRATKVLLTNLFNPTLPLLRYELTDEVTVVPEPCRCGSAHRRIDDIQGRVEDNFVYGAIHVHAYAFAAPLERLASIAEYQVRQTRGGAAIAVRCRQPVDLEHLGREITDNLRRLGVDRPEVILTPVESLERQRSGKLRRFVPLGST